MAGPLASYYRFLEVKCLGWLLATPFGYGVSTPPYRRVENGLRIVVKRGGGYYPPTHTPS